MRERDGFNPAPFNYSQTPNERTSLWLLGSRPLGESANFFVEGFAHHRESAQQAAPANDFTALAAPALADGSLAIRPTTITTPLGLTCRSSTAAWWRAATANC